MQLAHSHKLQHFLFKDTNMETAKLHTVVKGVSETADGSENIVFCSTFACSLGRNLTPLRVNNKIFI